MTKIIITQTDRQMARDALVEAYDNCEARLDHDLRQRACDCDLGAIDGCKAKVEAIAKAIATARKI